MSTYSILGSPIIGDLGKAGQASRVKLSGEGTRMIVSEMQHNNSYGRVGIYEWNTGTNGWDQMGAFIDGPEQYSGIGRDSDINSTGDIIAIGIGRNTKLVKTFQWNSSTTTWDSIGDIPADGESVALNDLGTRIAIGTKDADTTSVYDYVGGSWVIDAIIPQKSKAYGISSLDMTLDGNYLAISNVDAGGGVGEVTAWVRTNANTWEQLNGWTGDAGGASDSRLGHSIAIKKDGTTITIAAVDSMHTNQSGQLKIYIFDTVAGTAPTQITIDGTQELQQMSAVDLGGDKLAVGFNRHNNINGSDNAGKVEIYTLPISTGDLPTETIYKSQPTGPTKDDWFGGYVSLSTNGSRLAIGASGHLFDSTGNYDGLTQVYDNGTGGGDGETATITQVGNSIVSMQSTVFTAVNKDGSRIVVGDYLSNRARVFEKSNGSWTQIGTDFTGENNGDNFGNALAINGSGNRVAIGAKQWNQSRGKVVVYEYNEASASWDEIGSFTGVDAYDYCGASVCMDESGDTIAICTPSNNVLSDAGQVHVHRWNSATATWDADGEIVGNVDDQIGNDHGLALNSAGNVLVLIKRRKSSVHAAFRFYEYVSDTWTLQGGDVSVSYAESVDVSADGLRVVIGASSANAVYIYNNAGVLLHTFTGDKLGNSVAISDDGTRIIAGGKPLDSTGYYSGHARVLEEDESGTWNMLEEYNGTIQSHGVGYWVAMSGDGKTFAYSNTNDVATGTFKGETFVYQIQVIVDLNADFATAVSNAISGTSIDAAVATAANADVAAVAVDADDAAATTTSTTALQRFSNDSEFENANFTKVKKREVFKNLMKQIVNLLTDKKFVMHDKIEFLKFIKPNDDTIDLNAKLKDKIAVIQPGTTNVTVNMDDASVYVPFGDGETQTFVDSVTGKEFTMGKSGSDFTLTVADSQGGAHSIPPNYTSVADQEGQVYTYTDVANNRETIFVWGSGTASSNNTTGQVQGDPYITTLTGVTYKMDDFTGFVRLLQGEYEGKTFTINAENKLLTKSEIKELLEWRQTNMQGMNFSDTFRFGKFPAYFSKFYISHGDKYAIVDANSLEVLETNYDPQMAHSIQINQGYVWSEAMKTVSRVDLTVGELQISMMSYEDKDIRNGFKLFNMDKLQNRSGALEHPIYVKDMKIRSIRSMVPIKQQSARKNKKVSKEEIIENGLKTHHTFKVF